MNIISEVPGKFVRHFCCEVQPIHQVLNQRYEQGFSEYSYGFRPHRSAHDALLQSCKYIEQVRNFLVDLDVEKFFDKVTHDRLMWLLRTRIEDEKVLELYFTPHKIVMIFFCGPGSIATI